MQERTLEHIQRQGRLQAMSSRMPLRAQRERHSQRHREAVGCMGN